MLVGVGAKRIRDLFSKEVGGQAVLGRQVQTATPWLTKPHRYDPTLVHSALGRQHLITTPWLTERHGYDPTFYEND